MFSKKDNSISIYYFAMANITQKLLIFCFVFSLSLCEVPVDEGYQENGPFDQTIQAEVDNTVESLTCEFKVLFFYV